MISRTLLQTKNLTFYNKKSLIRNLLKQFSQQKSLLRNCFFSAILQKITTLFIIKKAKRLL